MTVRNGVTVKNEEQSDGAPIEQRLATQVRTLEAWYATEFERRIAELTEKLEMQLQIQIEELKQHYERREKTIQGKARVSSGTQNAEKLLEEIKYTEIVAQKFAMELESMVADDTVNLGLLLQKRNQQLELKAYLRGLKFDRSEGSQVSPTHPDQKII